MTPANYVQEYKGRFYVAEYTVTMALFRGGAAGCGRLYYGRRSDALRKARELYGE
jgi:hypothetical protein